MIESFLQTTVGESPYSFITQGLTVTAEKSFNLPPVPHMVVCQKPSINNELHQAKTGLKVALYSFFVFFFLLFCIVQLNLDKNVVQVLYISAHEQIQTLLVPLYAHILTVFCWTL